MASPSLEQSVISILQTTKEFAGLSKEQFPEDKNRLDDSLDEALGQLSMANLSRLGLRRPLQGGTEVVDVATTMDLWVNDEKRLQMGRRARKLYIAKQNEAIGELLDGRAVTVLRRPDSLPAALATNPRDGFTPVEGPVTATFMQAAAQHGAIGIGIRPSDYPSTAPTEALWIAHVLNPANQTQLDIRIDA